MNFLQYAKRNWVSIIPIVVILLVASLLILGATHELSHAHVAKICARTWQEIQSQDYIVDVEWLNDSDNWEIPRNPFEDRPVKYYQSRCLAEGQMHLLYHAGDVLVVYDRGVVVRIISHYPDGEYFVRYDFP